MRFLLCLRALLVLCAAWAAGPSLAQSGPPLLAPGDEIEVSVFGRPEYSTTALISSEGVVAINGLGRVTIAGLTPAEVEDRVTEALLKLQITSPLVTVRVDSYRKVAVLGDVASPNLYEFFPNMTMLHALAQAGGLYRRPAAAQSDEYVSIVDTEASLSSLQDKLAMSEIRRDRIRAQIEGNAQHSAKTGELAEYSETESEIADVFVATRTRDRSILEQQLQAIEKQIALRLEIAATYKDQLQAAQDDVGRLEKLLDDGLVPTERVAGARDKLSSITIENLQNDSAYSAALQDRAQVELDLASLGASRTPDLARELRDVVSEIQGLQSDIGAARERLRVLKTLAAEIATDPDKAGYSVSYVVARQTATGEVEKIVAAETDFVQPGDVVIITRTILKQ
ncbi:MAG: polysaccharide biosynthesis/export family protein [Defluviimonas sp.]|uniref:polysaccharide biosynthesis/export family protein n=1 Tax=Albidovulum sp. TaxID=1872424 RepID=UPI002A2D93F1|nr:polysaccharide biosynthesis/export family protein [Defluviimonas sp.]